MYGNTAVWLQMPMEQAGMVGESFLYIPIVHLKTKPAPQFLVKGWLSGAGGRTRTADQLITNQLLYRLSYTGRF